LIITGAGDDAMKTSEGLLAAADATDNPHVVSLALLAYGYARRDADPCAAYHVRCRGLRIAQDSANRQSESNLAVSLSRLAATHGDPMYAFDYLTNAGDPQPLSRSSHTQGLKFRVPVSVLTSPGCPMGHETETNRLWCRSASPLA
jgi:hypothetical protein